MKNIYNFKPLKKNDNNLLYPYSINKVNRTYNDIRAYKRYRIIKNIDKGIRSISSKKCF